jgi:TRAP-type C4-dicarboxylate transport system permease small subunit
MGRAALAPDGNPLAHSPHPPGVTLRRLLSRLYDWAGYAAAICIVLIFAAMIGASAVRQLGVAVAGIDDVVSWLTAAAASLGMAHSFRNGDFVRMTLVIDRLPSRPRRLVEVAALAIALIGTAYAAYWTVRSVYESWIYQEMTSGLLVMPLWIPQISFAIGTVLLFIALADEFVNVVRGGTPSYVDAVEERRARGDYSQEI